MGGNVLPADDVTRGLIEAVESGGAVAWWALEVSSGAFECHGGVSGTLGRSGDRVGDPTGADAVRCRVSDASGTSRRFYIRACATDRDTDGAPERTTGLVTDEGVLDGFRRSRGGNRPVPAVARAPSRVGPRGSRR